MTTTIPTSKSACSVTTRPGNAAVDYGGAQIRAYLHHLATVVTIRGEIDAANVEQISEHVRRFSLGTNPMVLDLSELSHFSGAGKSMFPMARSVHKALHDLADAIDRRRQLVLPLISRSA
nr:STAS domain-containing protein [Mycobacterium tuberculosis]